MLTRALSTIPARVEDVAARCIGCGIEVHRRLGPGSLEAVYQDAMVIELEHAGLHVEREVPVVIHYQERPLRTYRIDLVVGTDVILELEAVQSFDRLHEAQLMSYLRATGLRLGLLMNFNSERLKSGLRRVVI